MSNLPTRHYTSTGRIVYERKPNRMTWHDARRILSSLPMPDLDDTKDVLDCYTLINSVVDVRIGLFDKDLVKEFFGAALKAIINLIGKPTIFKNLQNKLGKRLSDLIGLLWDSFL